ncbi:hypothetical protein TWF718_007878 [Orbilia javanica]|uniref:Enterotoxin n=1 Tax=Orbilia javanica TaxID=47235 RepID=A0AAN8RH85_9PEZI
MLSHSIILLLTAFLYSTPSTSLSYSMISTKDIIEDPKDSTPKTYAPIRPVGCTLMTDTPLLPTGAQPNIRPSDRGSWAGIAIHQDTWSQESKWLGFWSRRECNRNLPSLIIHWYPDAPTDQLFDIRRLREYIPRLSEGDFRYMSWGEMTAVPQAIVDNVAPGSVAVREKKPSRVLGAEDQAWYAVFNDIVRVRTSPNDPMEDDLSGYSARGRGSEGKQLHLTFQNEQFTRAVDGPGGEVYPIPEDQVQDLGQVQQEEQILVSGQPSGRIPNSPVGEVEDAVSSRQQSSPGTFPEATVLLRIDTQLSSDTSQEADAGEAGTQIVVENPSTNVQQGSMEEEFDNAPQNQQTNALQPSQSSPAAEQLEEIIQQQLDFVPNRVDVDAILRNIGTNVEGVAQAITGTGVKSAILFVLNRIASQRLHLEMSMLTPVQTLELAGHQMSQWGPFALANSLGEMRIRREIRSGGLTPEMANRLRARAASVATVEVGVANKAVQDVVARMVAGSRNSAQEQVLIEPGPEIEEVGSFNDLLENVAPMNSANSASGGSPAGAVGLNNNIAPGNGRLPGGDIELEEEIFTGEDNAAAGELGLDDEVWRDIVVHSPIEEEQENVRRLTRGAVLNNISNRVNQLNRGNAPDSASESEYLQAGSVESPGAGGSPIESSPYVPEEWEDDQESFTDEEEVVEEEEAFTPQDDLVEDDLIEDDGSFTADDAYSASEEEFITSQDNTSDEGDYVPDDSSNSEGLRRGRSRGRPRGSIRTRGQGQGQA